MKKLEVLNIASILLLSFSFFKMIKIDNDSRLPENVNTDYYMNSLPYIYVIIICILLLTLVTCIRMIKSRRN